LQPLVLVVLGSDSDLPRVGGLLSVFEELEVPFELTLCSAHRDPERTARVAAEAGPQGIRVVIAAAGMAAHLAGALAARTVLPVIGVPLGGSALAGVVALLSTVQMPRGIPVATVGIDRADNAAYLAAQIVALTDPALALRLEARRDAQRGELVERDRRLQDVGPRGYLEERR